MLLIRQVDLHIHLMIDRDISSHLHSLPCSDTRVSTWKIVDMSNDVFASTWKLMEMSHIPIQT